ncbi:MAG TPA: electron transport complex subunit RsxC [Candidatus Marinimicrobia bacterium]|nr:electron transport complex subunit RsxC [Candidatus Neomarinimicrobiota bacterium]
MKVLTFRKGIHPKEFKELTEHKPIEKLPTPKEVFIPLQQHIGSPAKAVVQKGEEVKAGQIIGESTGFISSYIHASINGKVKTIDTFLHPLGLSTQTVHITSSEEASPLVTDSDTKSWESLSKEDIISIIEKSGIVGLGGATFPTHVKLKPPKDKPIDTFILNGCECEPYLTADHRMMLDFTDKVVQGVLIITRTLGVKKAYIGIENNKPDAIEKMSKATSKIPEIEVVALKTKYPQGAEKMLIKAVLDRTVPAGGLPMDVGVVVNNVGTALTIYEAVVENKPLIERVVTVTGNGIKEPKNLLIPIGTKLKDVIDYCGGLTGDNIKVIMGGPMMGITIGSLEVPVIKGTSGILCLKDGKNFAETVYPCIGCGSCTRVCPMNLLPTKLARLSEKGMWEMANKMGILNCIECGSCAYVCPSHIPLVQHIKVGKFMVNQLKK